MFTDLEKKEFFTMLHEIASAAKTSAIGVREVFPKAAYVTGGGSGVIPKYTKAFNIINLGLNGTNSIFEPIAVAGIAGITEILPGVKVFGYSIENDQNRIEGPITVTPAVNHVVLLQYLV